MKTWIRTISIIALAFFAATAAQAQYSTPSRDVDNPDRFPYQLTVRGGMPVGTRNAIINFAIPAGKRVVAEYVGVTCNTSSSSDTFPYAFMFAYAPGSSGPGTGTNPSYQSAGMTLPNPSRSFADTFGSINWAVSSPVKVYAEGPGTLGSAGFSVSVGHTDLAVGVDCSATITGHTVTP